MKLSDETRNVLKNYSTINNSILIEPGNVIKTLSPSMSIYSEYTAKEEFKTQIVIYDLSKFLGAISLFADPDFNFTDKYVEIVDGDQKIKFVYADPSNIIAATRAIKLPTEDVKFKITAMQLQNVVKSLGILRLSEVCIVGKGGNVYLQTANSDDPTTDSYSVVVGETDQTFSIVFHADNMKFIQRDYDVVLSFKNLARFESGDISYFIPAESKSKR